MAITPEKAGQVTQEELQSVDKAEKVVDGLLRVRFQGSGSVQIAEHICNLSERCRKELLRRFRAAGWQIEKKHESGDQRDSRERSYDYWVFKPAPVYRNTGFAEQINNPAPSPWEH